MMRRAALIAMLAAGLAACPRTDRRADIGMTDTTFVHTMLRLHAVAVDSSLDSLARDSARKMVLRENHVTAAQLDAAVESLAFDSRRAESLWSRIDRETKKKGPTPLGAPSPAPPPKTP
jgi:hypothetical protein